MKLLVDTQLLLWAASSPGKVSAAARDLMEDLDNGLFFSAASIWEVIIKSNLGRSDFKVDAHLLRRGLLDNGWKELPISSNHALAVSHLPNIHKDPFDRILLAQAEAEGSLLLTADSTLGKYPGSVQVV